MSRDPQMLFSRAERAFGEGRFADARGLLVEVEALIPTHPAIPHLRAVAERRLGNSEEARAAFRRALALAPADPQLANNFGNLLSDLGEFDSALDEYRRAARLRPGFLQAELNAALTLHQLRRFDEAALAYERALALDPTSKPAVAGRARVARAQGDPEATGLYARASTADPQDRQLLIEEAETRAERGDAGAAGRLAAAVAADPLWLEGQDALARIRWEMGEEAASLAGLTAALAAHPAHEGLHAVHLRLLADRGDYARAADAARDAALACGAAAGFALWEAAYAGLAGEHDRAERLFAALPSDLPGRAPHEARHRIRRGELDRAEALLERIRTAAPDDIPAWSLTELVWRAGGDSRSRWLSGQAGLSASLELGLSRDELDELAELLRALHRLRAHPLGQSLRGGTQTRHRLFDRRDPQLARLREALRAAVAAYVSALPPRDPDHPLLRHRGAALDFAGSWSVRLTRSGHHVSHIHPAGLLSSACYISLPALDARSCEGWLELGVPPRDLELALPPLAMVEPAAGRVALFPSYLFHGTRPFAGGERLTVAFDVGLARQA